jgi:hypothetical protein
MTTPEFDPEDVLSAAMPGWQGYEDPSAVAETEALKRMAQRDAFVRAHIDGPLYYIDSPPETTIDI